MNFCRDCKYYDTVGEYGSEICRHPRLMMIDPVSGRRVGGECAGISRGDKGHCAGGKNFSPASAFSKFRRRFGFAIVVLFLFSIFIFFMHSCAESERRAQQSHERK